MLICAGPTDTVLDLTYGIFVLLGSPGGEARVTVDLIRRRSLASHRDGTPKPRFRRDLWEATRKVIG